ncbi:hypothetical protein J2045_004287 [Peteryoungia aggregata LMG 23059]|uniref:Avidin family protein n=1 Tax=Peteryoungia aggregata LMG 23059 TaxID=1368425 RepID=A0ABU0GF40_9HYPH|nr:avidin/streptavidin family protein [Peteryoungia aggregata]MDQ0423235.1 hypothetical protein [Peteryoungia aggregata LMG 23059]
MARVLSFLIALFFSTTVMAFTSFKAENFMDFSSLSGASTTWINELGSVMTIDVASDGSVSGTYVNNAQGTGCQGTPYVLNGRVTGNTIAFSVAWSNGTANCNSVTGWAGYAQVSTGNTLQIVTQWNLAYMASSGGQIQSGKDVFTYQPQIVQQSLLEK